ncbi:unnamed protein product [Danaus chrysippus]|uniref:(African queen) hypothetical protein n=1 Tax=Danaus chrysippus TaxID=151541 RepID=A0A8J2W4F8_9NEOP|nr:unnamed protein product [Danaus chrysippus]
MAWGSDGQKICIAYEDGLGNLCIITDITGISGCCACQRLYAVPVLGAALHSRLWPSTIDTSYTSRTSTGPQYAYYGKTRWPSLSELNTVNPFGIPSLSGRSGKEVVKDSSCWRAGRSTRTALVAAASSAGGGGPRRACAPPRRLMDVLPALHETQTLTRQVQYL